MLYFYYWSLSVNKFLLSLIFISFSCLPVYSHQIKSSNSKPQVVLKGKSIQCENKFLTYYGGGIFTCLQWGGELKEYFCFEPGNPEIQMERNFYGEIKIIKVDCK
jgi:hypothetical protein